VTASFPLDGIPQPSTFAAMIFGKSLLLLAILAAPAACLEQWYPFRMEVSSSNATGIGLATGVLWSFHEEVIPQDAYGPTIGIGFLRAATGIIPEVRIGGEAEWKIFCIHMQYCVYKTSNTHTVPVVNPQIGFSWERTVSACVGLNKTLFGPAVPGLGGINISLSITYPSYAFCH
jgi:hypothetical protein